LLTNRVNISIKLNVANSQFKLHLFTRVIPTCDTCDTHLMRNRL